MTFDELLTKVRTKAESADVSASDFLAVQVNITGSLKVEGDAGKALEFSKILKK